RRQAPPQQQPPRDRQPYQQPAPQPYPQQHQQQYRPQPQPQPYQPQPQPYQPPPQQQYAPPQQPQQPAPRAPREPRRRSANPMRIPGLGCLKGCLFTLVLLFVASWLIWELTPLKDWIGQGQSYWHAITDAVTTVKDWVSDLGGGSGGN
ncbi:serine/threonine protein kinase, partial [Streptomyces sp. OfavH-34-F]|nr:serine/threonine protein kinase [Streptomyces sp. OfavH-34-F]